jgi:hypothetical protein
MRKAFVLLAASAALFTSACVTVIDAGDDDHINWRGENAQPFDGAYEGCERSVGERPHSREFRDCMAAKGWTPGR